MRRTFAEKRAWVLRRLRERYEYSCRTSNPPMTPIISASEQEDQEAWQKEFGGKEVIYTLGPNVSPDFAKTLRRMWLNGDLKRGTQGNQDARYYNQKTYYVFYSIHNWSLIQE